MKVQSQKELSAFVLCLCNITILTQNVKVKITMTPVCKGMAGAYTVSPVSNTEILPNGRE